MKYKEFKIKKEKRQAGVSQNLCDELCCLPEDQPRFILLSPKTIKGVTAKIEK